MQQPHRVCRAKGDRSKEELIPGLLGEKRIVVTEEYSAKHLGSGNVMVLATPAMIMLMERTALSSVDPLLPVGQRTVGTWLDVKHLAATPLGMTVRIHTELLEVEGRRLKFRVEAFRRCRKGGRRATRAVHHRRGQVPKKLAEKRSQVQ